jgi:hypothetical protein
MAKVRNLEVTSKKFHVNKRRHNNDNNNISLGLEIYAKGKHV